MTGRVEGKVALITGAARGQGRSHAIRLAEEGADIIALDCCAPVETVRYDPATPEDLQETVVQVEKLGQRIVSAQADVRDLGALADAVDEGVRELGRLDIVSANAGICSYGSILDLTPEAWSAVIDVDLTGVWNTCKATTRHLINSRGGSITLTSSAAGLKGFPNMSHYSAAKHGVVGLMRGLANELAEYSIRVNSIHPGCVDTPMLHNKGNWKLFVPDVPNPTREQFAERASAINALPVPWLDSIDMSNALLFLASDEARYITGVALPVDAGNSNLVR
jgi:SDR family mycofactocin-dependent oxidoreductase